MNRHELHYTLSALLDALVTDQTLPEIREAELSAPLEVDFIVEGGETQLLGTASTTRWSTGVEKPLADISMRVTLEEAEH